MQIGKLFERIERYMTRLTGDATILNFDNFSLDNRKIDRQQSEALKRMLSQGRSQPNQKKIVKDGVDILQMDVTKDPSATESTLEFILNTLCRALSMKPK